jgi:light-regulated signal transduction histidine kinase (bacteriophytochrome)
VSNFTELLTNNYGDHFDDTGKRSLRYIAEGTDRMRALVKGLLDYIRLGRDKELTTVDCNEIVKAIQEDLAVIISESNTSFEVENLPKLRGYETELRLLFQNLISNAIKFKKSGVAPRIRISAEKGNGWTFAIQDNGIGIAEDHQERIFTIFQRLHSKSEYEGT